MTHTNPTETPIPDNKGYPNCASLPLFIYTRGTLGGKFRAAEVEATAWLLRNIQKNANLTAAKLELFFGLADSNQLGKVWNRYKSGNDSPMKFQTRDRIARIAIKREWLPIIELLPKHPVTDLAYGTTRGFDYKSYTGPSDWLSQKEIDHRKAAFAARELQQRNAQKCARQLTDTYKLIATQLPAIQAEWEVALERIRADVVRESVQIEVVFAREDDPPPLASQLRMLAENVTLMASRVERLDAVHWWWPS